jgi:predicted MFS family arabinose efflux permease
MSTLLLVSILSQIDRILPFIMSESIKIELVLSDTQIGLINGVAFALCYSLAALPLARLSDKGWAKQILIGCILVWSIMTGLGATATSFLLLTLLRLGVAVGEAGGAPASHAIISQYIAPNFRGRAIGLMAMGIPAGTMLGFVAGGWSIDHIGWRSTFLLAGLTGVAITFLITIITRRYKIIPIQINTNKGFIESASDILQQKSFKWLFLAANLIGFASAPFYVFSASFLIRKFELTTSDVGIRFGLLQGILGIIATLTGGRFFDKLMSQKVTRPILLPAIILLLSAITTVIALHMNKATSSILFMLPAMFSFAFILPFAFGTGHFIAGKGNYAMSSSLLLLATSLLGPSLSPVLVGYISDQTMNKDGFTGLQQGLLIGPVATVLCAIACLKVRLSHNKTIIIK